MRIRSHAGAVVALVTMLVALGRVAHADLACKDVAKDGVPFVTCFDPGTRLALMAGTDGYGAAIDWRNTLHVDADIRWRFEHEFVRLVANPSVFTAAVYSGRYLRHSRDGHIVIPLGKPKKVFLPFNIGVEADFGALSGEFGQSLVDVGVVRTALLFELTRSADFRTRVSIGPVARWDLSFDTDTPHVTEHQVAPFSLGMLDLYFEDQRGLTVADLRVEGGAQWSTLDDWHKNIVASASLERVFIAVNDRPVSAYATASYDAAAKDFRAAVGVRFAIITGKR